jgi:predicted XRE-type DNA-binding protein
MKNYDIELLAKKIGLPKSRAYEAATKAKLIKEIITQVEQNGFTHAEVAEMAGVARSTVTGIISGSLQKVSLDRLVRILSAMGFIVDFKIKKAS